MYHSGHFTFISQVTASGDQTAVLWDIQHGKRLAVFRGHSSSLKSVDFQEGSPCK